MKEFNTYLEMKEFHLTNNKYQASSYLEVVLQRLDSMLLLKFEAKCVDQTQQMMRITSLFVYLIKECRG